VVFTLGSPQDVGAPYNGHDDIDVHFSLLPGTADADATRVGSTTPTDQADAGTIEQLRSPKAHKSGAESLQTHSSPPSTAMLQPALQPQHQTAVSAIPSTTATLQRGTEPLMNENDGQQVVEPLAPEDNTQRKTTTPIVTIVPPVSRPVQRNEQHLDSTQPASIHNQHPVSGATSNHSVAAMPRERVGAGGANKCCIVM
jgi:lipoprotein-anchoring transpeptidase ErfK/SrfK